MKILLAGPIEGAIDALYAHAAELSPHWIVCAGDFGIWPDPERMDRASRQHAVKDFSKHYVGMGEPLNISTLTVAGVHDDNKWLAHRQSVNNTEILNNVHWLAQGYRTTIGWGDIIRVTGVGRAYSEATYSGESGKRSHRHYTRRDIERACSSGPTDLLVLYEHLDEPGLRNVIYATRPKLILNVQHPNHKLYEEVQDIPVIQLARNETKLIEYAEDTFIL
jgi:hypothetical protein